jgi:hypothetical protein
MLAWRVACAGLLALTAVPAAWSQTCTLAEMVKPGDCFRYSIEMKLSGEMRFNKDGMPS